MKEIDGSSDGIDYQALAAFRHALRRFAVFSETAAGAAGLTPQQHQALLAIKGNPGGEALNIREISERLLVRHHSAVELVDRLARMGMVERESDPDDRRRVLVRLTAEGQRRLAALSQAHLDELRAVRPLLAGLLERFEPRDGDGGETGGAPANDATGL